MVPATGRTFYFNVIVGYVKRYYPFLVAAWAAASLAIETRNGEHET